MPRAHTPTHTDRDVSSALSTAASYAAPTFQTLVKGRRVSNLVEHTWEGKVPCAQQWQECEELGLAQEECFISESFKRLWLGKCIQLGRSVNEPQGNMSRIMLQSVPHFSFFFCCCCSITEPWICWTRMCCCSCISVAVPRISLRTEQNTEIDVHLYPSGTICNKPTRWSPQGEDLSATGRASGWWRSLTERLWKWYLRVS